MATSKQKQKQKQLEIAERRKLVAGLLLNRTDQADIVAILKNEHPDWEVSQPTISRDITWLKGQWLERSKTSIDDVKAQELAELNDMERKCAVQASADKKRGVEWARLRLSIKERKAKMFGLDTPIKQEIRFEKMSNADLIKYITGEA